MDIQNKALIEILDGENSKFFWGIFSRPVLKVNHPVEIPYHTSNYVLGKYEWDNIEFSFYDFGLEDFQYLDNWLMQQCNTVTGRRSYIYDYKKDIVVKEIDIENFVVQEWRLYGAYIAQFSTEVSCDFKSGEIFPNILTRKVLFEKINNPTMQITKAIEVGFDRATLY